MVVPLFFLLNGCVHRAGTPPAPPVPENPQQVKARNTLRHLLGAWELLAKGGVKKQMIFQENGQLIFQGGLEYFNPASWSLDVDRGELRITMPQAANDKLDIFHMTVGDGVKAFDRERKQVTYTFDQDTWSLNVAGWPYSKPEERSFESPTEPTLK